jgi:hypothetical protein
MLFLNANPYAVVERIYKEKLFVQIVNDVSMAKYLEMK